MAIAAVSCNPESKPLYQVIGSLEGTITPHLVGPDGARYTIAAGGQYLQKMPDDLFRSRAEYFFHTVDETKPGIDDRVNIELIGMELLPTYETAEWGSIDYDDPVLLPNISLNSADIEGLTPGIATSMNYLDMYLFHVMYRKNAASNEMYAPVKASLEVDPEIIPAQTSGACDTIRMVLKFDNNRADSEKIANAYGPILSRYSFDLEASTMPSFPKTENGENKMYIIKMAYQAYDDVRNWDDDEIVTRTVTTKWVPNDPYWKGDYSE